MGNSHAPVEFWDSYWGCMIIANGLLVLLSYITGVAVNWNRMSVIPMIISVVGFVANYLAWVSYEDLPRARLFTVRFIAQFGWHVQEQIAVFYSYFLLQKLLHNSASNNRFWNRRVFNVSFWCLTAISIADRIAVLGMYVRSWDMNDKTPGYTSFFNAIQYVSTLYFVATALTEILTAAFLIKMFHSATKTAEMYCGGEKVGMFKQLALSTEIRLASLAILGFTRAACSHTRDINKVAYGFDTVMWTLENIYPMVLIVDLLMAKMMSGFFTRVDKATRTVVDGGKCNCGRREEGQRFMPPSPPRDLENSLASSLSPQESAGDSSKGPIAHYASESLEKIKSDESGRH